jgi:hypothetical protein
MSIYRKLRAEYDGGDWDEMEANARRIAMVHENARMNQRMSYILAGNDDFRKATECDDAIDILSDSPIQFDEDH